MENKNYLVALVAGLVILAGLAGYGFGKSQSGTFGAGTTIGPSTAGGLESLYNNLASLLADVAAVRAPMANMIASSTTWDPGSMVAVSGQGIFATTSVAGLGSSITTNSSDWCVATLATDTIPSSGLLWPSVNCTIIGTGTAQVRLWTATGTFDFSGKVNVTAYDGATYLPPSALQTSTSTTAGN